MIRSLRIAALQLRAHDRADFSALGDRLLAAVDEAARECDLLVLPEATFPAYVLGDDRVDDTAIEQSLASLARIARERTCVIVAGAAVRREGRLYNSAVVIDRDGTRAGSAEKLFLWHFDRKWFAAGERIAPVRTSIGSLGVLVCADGRMPQIARTLVDRGAELLVMPTAWVTSGRDPQRLENAQADLLARVRALENGVPFVAANKCGVEAGMTAYCGKSQIVDASGALVALASEHDEERIGATVAVGAAPRSRTRAHAPEPVQVRPRTLRLALCADALPPDIDERLRTLDADAALAPRRTAYDPARILHAARIDALDAFDPATTIAYRLAGYRLIVLDAAQPHPWLEPIARARALELRIYVVLFDGERARAIDPDGTVIAGTFGAYRIASAAIDLARTEQTMVAPGTDVAEGLARIAALAADPRA